MENVTQFDRLHNAKGKQTEKINVIGICSDNLSRMKKACF